MRTLAFLPWSKAIQADLDGCVSLWEKLYDHIHSSAPYKSDDVSFAACLWRLGGYKGWIGEAGGGKVGNSCDLISAVPTT